MQGKLKRERDRFMQVGVVVALWMVDAECGYVDAPVRLGVSSEEGVTVLDTFGNKQALQQLPSSHLGLRVGRDVVYIVFGSSSKVATVGQAAELVRKMLEPAVASVAGSIRWLTPFKSDDDRYSC
eukprot:COSAG06_NODE_409_length_16096_cov_27.922548_5_plen_125_part_00